MSTSAVGVPIEDPAPGRLEHAHERLAEGRLAAADSPTRPSVSPARMSKLDAVDRADVADGAAEDAAADREVHLAGPRLRMQVIGRRLIRDRPSARAGPRASAQAAARRRARRELGAAGRSTSQMPGDGLGRSGCGTGSPSGGPSGCGTMPAMAVSRCRGAAAPTSGSSAAAPGCRGAAGRRRSRRPLPRSTTLPRYITATSSAISATTPRSWVMNMHRHADLVLQVARSGRGCWPGW